MTMCSVPLQRLEDAPNVLCSVAEFAAGNAGTEVEVADTNAVVLDGIGEVIVALRHGADEDRNALVFVEATDVVTQTYDLGVETESDLSAVGWQVIGDGVLDDLDQLLLRRS